MKSTTSKTVKNIEKFLSEYPELFDEVFIRNDLLDVRRTKNIRLVPSLKYRIGGKVSYGEWCHVIGIFQTLINITLRNKINNKVLDVGCGTGILGIAAEPFLGDGGSYTGIDVSKEDIEFCQKHYDLKNFNFVHLNVYNARYSPKQNRRKGRWLIKSNSKDLITALSVWTHFNEEDAKFYIKEVDRVLHDGGKAIITFFILDDVYNSTLASRDNNKGKFHASEKSKWIFNKKVYDSENWHCPAWVKMPESAIGITEDGLNELLQETSLKIDGRYNGNWKEIPGLFFQDIIVLRKRK